MTKELAQQRRDNAIEAVKNAQALCAKTVGIERDRAKAGLAAALEELRQAKVELRKANLAAAGAAPLETQGAALEPGEPRRKLTTQELSVVLLESFQQLLIADPSHPAIATLRQHFTAERMKEIPPAATLRPSEPLPLRSAGRPFLDSLRRQSGGPGSTLYKQAR
jgi:hypothetical protein